MSDIKLAVGKRYLVKFGFYDVSEILVLELSPTGEYVKVQYLSKAVAWRPMKDVYGVLEELPSKLSFFAVNRP